MSPTIPQLLDRGMAHHDAGRFADAENDYRAILELDPDHPDANNLLGLIAELFGHYDDAIAHAERAIAAVPACGMFHCNLGTALIPARRYEEAIAAFRRAMALEPTGIAAPYNLGMLYLQRNDGARAAEGFARVLELDPSHPTSRHLLTALSGGERPDSAPPEYVASLFDSYARGFDVHLRTHLSYRIPEEIRACFTDVPAARTWTVIDLGCGTGSCGALFREAATHLVGCDLSAGMLAQATELGIYDELWHEDLVATLGRFDASADVIIAADVFIYVGALGPSFAAAARALRPGGRLAFSVEAADAEFVLRASGRFAHAAAYVASHAAAAGLTVSLCEPTTVRTEEHAPIPGHLFVLTR